MTAGSNGVSVLDTDAALHGLAPEWHALWASLPGASPFASPAWLLPWWRQFGTGQPLVAVQRQAGRLVGVLALYVLHEPGCRKLLPVGAGTTDQLDALLTPGVPAGPLLQAVLDRARPAGVDVCDLIEVPPGSALHAIAPAGWSVQWSDGGPCPVLALPSRVAELAHILPGNTLRKLRMNRNRADRAGGVRVATADATTLAPMLEELIRLHQLRWTAQDEPGVLSDAKVLAFHRDAAPALLRAGVLRLQVLHMGGVTAAACYTLLAGDDRILFYLSGYDPQFASISPGSLLLASMIEQAIIEGRREADFLRGREAYKYAWGGVDRLNRSCRLLPV